jgi:predicted aconitase
MSIKSLGAALLLAVAVACTACAPAGPSAADDRRTAVAESVEDANDRVTDVTVAKSTDGLSVGWTVDVVVEGEPAVESDELAALLLAVRHADTSDPGHVDLFVTTSSGDSVDLTAPADELGLWYSDISTGIAVTRTAIDDVLGSGGD